MAGTVFIGVGRFDRGRVVEGANLVVGGATRTLAAGLTGVAVVVVDAGSLRSGGERVADELADCPAARPVATINTPTVANAIR